MKIQNTIYLSNFYYIYYLSLKYIINGTQKEQDVRNLKYCLETMYSKLNLFRLLKKDISIFSDKLPQILVIR